MYSRWSDVILVIHVCHGVHVHVLDIADLYHNVCIIWCNNIIIQKYSVKYGWKNAERREGPIIINKENKKCIQAYRKTHKNEYMYPFYNFIRLHVLYYMYYIFVNMYHTTFSFQMQLLIPLSTNQFWCSTYWIQSSITHQIRNPHGNVLKVVSTCTYM